MSSDGAIPGRHAGSGARPYILLGNASHHSASGVCDRVPSPPPSQDNAYFLKKNTELACHIAILTGPGGARAAICPTTTNSSPPLSGSAFLSSSGTVAAAAILLFLPLLQAPTVLLTPPCPSFSQTCPFLLFSSISHPFPPFLSCGWSSVGTANYRAPFLLVGRGWQVTGSGF